MVSITLERASDIFDRLAKKGFASSNVVLGIGSFTYQHNTRDTYGFAMKATGGIFGGEERALFKDPITDDGIKRSFRGFVNTFEADDGSFFTTDGLTFEEAVNHPESAFVEFDFQYDSIDAFCDLWDEIKERARAGL